MIAHARRFGPLLLLLAAPACSSREGPQTIAPDLSVGETTVRVDVLFVVDSNDEMEPFRSGVVGEIADAFERLGLGDLDGDGTSDVPPPRSIHVGVITANIGTGNAVEPLPGCSPRGVLGGPSLGDEAVLQTAGSGTGDCASSYPPFQVFGEGEEGTAANAGQAMGCIVGNLGGGCVIRQPIAAGIAAVSPSSTFPAFPLEGQADGANAGFLRPDSLLALLIVSNVDDCSTVSDPDIRSFRGDFPEPFGVVRCALNASDREESLLDSWNRLATRDRRLFGVMAGIPSDLLPADPEGHDVDRLLADPRMNPEADPTDADRLLPACVGLAPAQPARRLVAFTGGENSYLASICEPALSPGLRGFVTQILDATRRACIEQPWPLEIAVSCDLVEVGGYLDDGLGCDRLPARELIPGSDGRECRIDARRWRVDDSSDYTRGLCAHLPIARRVDIDADLPRLPGSRLRLECPRIACRTDAECLTMSPALLCDALTHTCRQSCRLSCPTGFRCEAQGRAGDEGICVRG